MRLRRAVVVDDDPVFRSMVIPLMKERGYTVKEAESGHIATRMLTEPAPEVLVVDGQLPDTKGIDWLVQARKKGWRCPVIFVAASASYLSQLEAMDADLNIRALLRKPIQLNVFASHLDTISEEAEARFASAETGTAFGKAKAGGSGAARRAGTASARGAGPSASGTGLDPGALPFAPGASRASQGPKWVAQPEPPPAALPPAAAEQASGGWDPFKGGGAPQQAPIPEQEPQYAAFELGSGTDIETFPTVPFAMASAQEPVMVLALDPSASLEDQRRQWSHDLPTIMKEVAHCWEAVRSDPVVETHWSRLGMVAHQLRSVGATLGFPDVTTAAGRLEDRILARTPGSATPPRAIERGVVALGGALRSAQDTEPVDALTQGQVTTATVLVLESDPASLEKIRSLASKRLVRVLPSTSARVALDLAMQYKVDAAIVVVDPRREQATWDFVARLRTLPGGARLPLALLGDADACPDAGTMVYVGATGFLARPITRQGLEGVLDVLTAQVQARRTRVVVVDDDPELAEELALTLRLNEMQATAESEPRRLLHTLRQVRPDIVLMDVSLRGASGFEVCRSLREEHDLADLPVIFMMSQPSLDSRIAALKVGAAGWVGKPVLAEELVARIQMLTRIGRLDRARNEVDAATEMLRRSAFADRCIRQIARCNDENIPLSLVWLRVDTFDELDDMADPYATERVIGSVARVFQARLRVYDLRCRWRDSDIVVAAQDLEQVDVRRLVIRLLDDLGRLKVHGSDGQVLPLSLRAGIATRGEDGYDFASLMSAARNSAVSDGL